MVRDIFIFYNIYIYIINIFIYTYYMQYIYYTTCYYLAKEPFLEFRISSLILKRIMIPFY